MRSAIAVGLLMLAWPASAQEWVSRADLDRAAAAPTASEVYERSLEAQAKTLRTQGYRDYPDGRLCLPQPEGQRVCWSPPVAVVGGAPTDDHPWQVELRSTFAYSRAELAADAALPAGDPRKFYLAEQAAWERSHRCGGTLIDAQWVITAAHCVHAEANGNVIRTREVVLGTSDLARGDGQAVPIDKVVIHARYDPKTNVNDIALVRLTFARRRPLLPLDRLNRIALAGPDAEVMPGTRVTVTGWGKTMAADPGETLMARSGRRNRASPQLQALVLVAKPQAECDALPQYRGVSGPGTICAAAAVTGADACQGDSGGPVTMQVGREEHQRRVLVGIVSQGIGCAYRGLPSLYTRVGAYRDWITRAIASPGKGVGTLE